MSATALDTLRESLPDYARDLKLNLQAVLAESGLGRREETAAQNGSIPSSGGGRVEPPRRRVEVARPSEDEDTEPLVGSPHAGRRETDPRSIKPDVGQVSKYGTECSQAMLGVGVSQTPRAGFHVAISSTAQ